MQLEWSCRKCGLSGVLDTQSEDAWAAIDHVNKVHRHESKDCVDSFRAPIFPVEPTHEDHRADRRE